MRADRAAVTLLTLATTLAGLATPTFDAAPPPPSPKADVIAETVLRSGDTLERALVRSQLEREEVSAIVHLSKVAVKRGQRVRQRQIIGRVGSSGLSTGPHLDYRVIKSGRFVNPLAEKFVPGAPVPPDRREAFRETLEALLERLDREAPFAPDASPVDS